MHKTHYKLLVCLMVFLCLIIIPTSFAADADSLDENIISDNSLDLVESVDYDDSLESLNIEEEILDGGESKDGLLEAHYYFNSSAENDGIGTMGNPYKYFNKTIKDNSVIHLANGVYELGSSYYNTNITIIGQDASQTILKGRLFEIKENFILQNITLDNVKINNRGKLNATNVIFCNGYRYDYYGGAIYTPISNGSVYLRNCSFYNNSATKSGGAIYSESDIEVIDCVFINNSADVGGAIYSKGANVKITDSKVIDNSANSFGGVFTFLKSDVKVVNLYGFNNTAKYDGGLIYQIYGNLTVSNSNFISNNAKNGAGIFVASTKRLTISNDNFTNNSANASAGAIYSILNNNTDMRNIIYENNTASDPIFNDLYNFSSIDLIISDNDYAMYIYNKTDKPLPSSYSSVTEGYVTPVVNQGSGGNCWAFATIATLESCILKASGDSLDFSEENMKNIAALYSIYGWNLETNGGGYDDVGLGYLLSWLGPVNDSDDKYDPKSLLSPVLSSIMHVQNVLYLKRDSYTDNDMIKRAIMDYGAVFSPVLMEYKNESHIGYYVYNNGTERPNHAVTLVGWNDTIQIPGAPGKGAWIVKNSWGKSSGNNGYFYLSYYDTSSIELGKWGDAFTFILNDTIKFDKNYQYDIAKTDFLFNTTKTAWYKNIFTATDNEYLTAVSTYFEKETTYKLFINVNNVSILNQSGFARPGYWTINLNEPIALNLGDIFEIAFKINVTGDVGVPISEAVSLNNVFYKENISFISYDGKTWSDLYDFVWNDYPSHSYKSQVACIKAFTVLDKIDVLLNISLSCMNVSENYFNPVNITVNVLNEYRFAVNCGQVRFNLSGEIAYAKVSNGVAKISHIFKKGFNNISAEFVSFAYNSPIVNSSVDITKYDLSMDANFSYYLNTAFVNVSLSEPINETIFFLFGYKNFTVKTVDGKTSVNLTDLNGGFNNLRVVLYPALYDCNELEYNFTVTVYDTKIIVKDFSTVYGNSYKYKIKLIDENGNSLSGKKLQYSLNGVNYSGTTDKNGEITLSNLKAGTYKLIVNFKGEKIYTESSNSSLITVKTTAVLPKYNNFTYGSKYSVKFLDKNLNPLKNANVTIVFAGKTYNLKTDSSGIVKIDNYLKPGSYTVKVKNPKTSEEKTHKIKVVARIDQNKDLAMYYGAGTYYKVRVLDNYGNIAKNVSVKFTLNGKTYYRTTNSQGIAGLKISLKPSSYTVSASYKGFTVKNKITVKSTIITKNLSKKKAKTIKFTAKLVNSKGSILKYKYITFKYKGKKYLRKTNKYGIATIGLKNLRRVKYTIYSSYGKLTVKNTIKVY